MILSNWPLCHHSGIGIKPSVTLDDGGIPKPYLFYFVTFDIFYTKVSNKNDYLCLKITTLVNYYDLPVSCMSRSL